MGDGNRIPRLILFEYSDSNVNVVSNYKLASGRIEDMGATQFRKFKPWDGQNINLLRGFSEETVDDFFEQEVHSTLEELLTWIRMKPYNLKKNEINFVCQRGILRNIGFTVYNNHSKWNIKVCRLNGVIHLSDHTAKEQMSVIGKKCCYSGIIFGDSMVTEKDDTFLYTVAECMFKISNA